MRHSKHDDPFYWPGLQDITASVDFTHVAEAANAAALDVLGYAEQGSYLLAAGLLDFAGAAAGDDAMLRAAEQVKRLTLPSEMGSVFKVMALGREYASPLAGFARRDERHRL